MITIFSYILTFLGILFWMFRAVTTLFFQLDMEFFAQPIDINTEIIVLFLTVPCMLLVIKRNIIGAAAYLGLYAAYYGQAIYESCVSMQGVSLIGGIDFILLCIGVIIPLLTFFDIFINKNRAGFAGDKKTDWYYKNKDYDRQYDERADKNQYKLR